MVGPLPNLESFFPCFREELRINEANSFLKTLLSHKTDLKGPVIFSGVIVFKNNEHLQENVRSRQRNKKTKKDFENVVEESCLFDSS